MSFFVENQTLIIAIVSAIVLPLIGLFLKSKSNEKRSKIKTNNVKNEAKIEQTQTVNVYTTDATSNKKKDEENLEALKFKTHILFIDDNTDFKVVNILKKAGWINTQMIEDVDSTDDLRIRNSHIIFVDIVGVGRKLGHKKQGLGLVKRLKERHTNKKIIIYSAQSTGNRFDGSFRIADDFLSKNSDPYEFEKIIEKNASLIWNENS